MKSPIKYPGGKAKLVNSGILKLPDNFNCYYEPFCGGASVFLEMINPSRHPSEISDISENLINFFQVVKYRVQELVDELKTNFYLKNNSEYYYRNRSRFNEITNSTNPIEKAALFIYLNKTGFNGMYRENKKGEYNIPFGKMKDPVICDSGLLFKVSKKLENTKVVCRHFTKVSPKKGDLVYLDPPYHKLFSGYTKNIFDENQHILLYEKIKEWSSLGVYIILSNSNTEFIQELYTTFTKIIIPIKYTVGKNRGQSEELLITN